MRESDRENAGSIPDYQRLFEEAPGLYMVLDPQLRVVAASNAYLEATLTSRESILGRHVFDIFPDNPDDPSADSVRNSRASFNRVLQTGAPDTIGLQRHDVRRPESEGGGFEVRYWSAVNYPILNADGSLAYIMHRVENVTEFVHLKQQGVEQTEMTDALREQAVKMEADLYARSREMAETSQKLKEANEELARLYQKTKELDALKTDFFANVSHELRTPLTLIMGPVQKILPAPNLTPEQRHELAIVERNARLLLKNVNDLLDLSKLDAGALQLEYASVDLAHLCRFVASHFESVAQAKQVRFTVQTPELLPAAVDPGKMQRVFLNLLSNAMKFTPEGGKVSLQLREEAAKAVFTIDDSGPGIPPELREAVFERFRQLDSGPARRHGGTGLGLAIAKEFVDLHQGEIAIAGSAEGGARFVVEVPLSAPEGTAVRTAASGSDEKAGLELLDAASPAAIPEPSGKPLPPDAPLVLVVEDNPEMRAFIAAVLGGRHRIATAADGVEGVEKALLLHPDLIVTDLMMPRMSGEAMIRELRRNRELDDVPVLLLTAKADEGTRVQLLSSGAQDSMVKPFSSEELLARVAGLIARKRKAEETLRESEERFRVAQELSPDGFTILRPVRDAEGSVVDFIWVYENPAIARINGTDPEAVVGRRLLDVFPGHRETPFFELYRQVAESGASRVMEAPWDEVSGSPIWFRVAVVPVGEDIAILAENITERKNAEEQLQQARAHLELRVQERTRELSDALQNLETETRKKIQAFEELRRSEQMLIQQSRLAAMGEMLLNISHQWRQPLNLVAAKVQQLGITFQYGGFSERLLYDNIDDVMATLKGMSHTIEDFHSFLASKKEKALFSVDEVIGKTVGLVAALFQSQGVHIEVSGSGGAQVYGDPNEYGQVLMNLLGNARDALLQRREAGRLIAIRGWHEGGKSVVTVTDNAGGIEDEISEKIFDPYFTTKELGKGSGVGLFLAKMIIENNMGGRLSFRNVEGGAQFEIRV